MERPMNKTGKPTKLFEDVLYRIKRLAMNLDHVVQVGPRG